MPCLLRHFLCCCGLREGVALIAYFQILFTMVEAIVALVWTSRVAERDHNNYGEYHPRFLVFPWFSFFNQLLVCVVALILLARGLSKRLAECFFWLFIVHTAVEIVMTIVEFSVGYSKVF